MLKNTNIGKAFELNQRLEALIEEKRQLAAVHAHDFDLVIKRGDVNGSVEVRRFASSQPSCVITRPAVADFIEAQYAAEIDRLINELNDLGVIIDMPDHGGDAYQHTMTGKGEEVTPLVGGGRQS